MQEKFNSYVQSIETYIMFRIKEKVAQYEITERYKNRLEEMIKECPELWIWSHNRWRHTPEKQAKRFGKSTLENRP